MAEDCVVLDLELDVGWLEFDAGGGGRRFELVDHLLVEGRAGVGCIG